MNKIISFIKKYRNYFIALGIIVCLVTADQVTKHVVKNNVEYAVWPGIEVIRNFFYITYSENRGAMNGILNGSQTFLIIVTIISIFAFGYMAKDLNFTNKKLYSWALTLIIAGMLGNFIDRLFNNGGVVDFLSFYPIGKGHDWVFNWLSLDPFPTFNIADSCLTVGVIAFAIAILCFEKDSFNKKTPVVQEEVAEEPVVEEQPEVTESNEEEQVEVKEEENGTN